MSILQRGRLDTRSMYRSVRYRVNRDEHTKTADPSTCNFRIKKNSVNQATMAHTIYSETYTKLDCQQIKEFMKTDYLKSFNSMMETNKKTRLRQISQRGKQKQPSFFEDARVILPAFEQNQTQVQQSQHSLLTPFVKPYSHIKLMLKNSQNQLKSQKQTCQQIKFGLHHINQSKTNQLNEIQKFCKDHFENIRSILRKNQINQQQRKLKTKRQLDQLQEQNIKNRQLFDQLDNKSSSLQITIFNSTPFNLKFKKDQNDSIYF